MFTQKSILDFLRNVPEKSCSTALMACYSAMVHHPISAPADRFEIRDWWMMLFVLVNSLHCWDFSQLFTFVLSPYLSNKYHNYDTKNTTITNTLSTGDWRGMRKKNMNEVSSLNHEWWCFVSVSLERRQPRLLLCGIYRIWIASQALWSIS